MSSWYICVTPGSLGIAMSASSADGVAPSTPTATRGRCHHEGGTRPGLLITSSRYPASPATIPLENLDHHCVADKVIDETRYDPAQALEDTRVIETGAERTQCTCVSALHTCLELCRPVADSCRVIWYAHVIVGADDDTRAHALGRCRAGCGLLRL